MGHLVSVPYLSGQALQFTSCTDGSDSRSVSVPYLSGQALQLPAVIPLTEMLLHVSVPYLSGQALQSPADAHRDSPSRRFSPLFVGAGVAMAQNGGKFHILPQFC